MMSVWTASALLLCGLGMAPLVLSASQALRWERDSLARGQAVLLAQDLSHRLHLNAAAASRYQLGWGEQPATLTCRDAPCSRDNWAQADLSQWRTQVGQVLPQGDAWLQGASSTLPARWLMLAWSSDASAEVSLVPPLPAPCPEGKRCLTWVLYP